MVLALMRVRVGLENGKFILSILCESRDLGVEVVVVGRMGHLRPLMFIGGEVFMTSSITSCFCLVTQAWVEEQL